jgi:hypothetical protein
VLGQRLNVAVAAMGGVKQQETKKQQQKKVGL